MPIYEYECQDESCRHRFEELARFSDPAIEICPECSGPVRKLLFPPAVIFKGSGFYATEYGKAKANKTPSAGDAAAGPARKDEAKAPDNGSSGNTTPSGGNGNTTPSGGNGGKTPPAGGNGSKDKPATSAA